MTRFLCIGDLHIGAGPDYGREPGDRLRDQEQVWARALELAVEHEVDAVLFAGDAFHRHTRTAAELRAFQRPLESFAAEHDIEILGIPGNHDVESTSAANVLEIFGRDIDMHFEPGLWHSAGRSNIAVPGGVTVATLPWAPVSRLVAARGGGDRDDVHAIAAQLLVETARDLRAQIDGPAVLMLHWSVSGASTPTGVATDDFRETVIPADELAALGFDAIVAGHIHKAQAFHRAHGWVTELFDYATQGPMLYTGSPAPVDFGEATVPHGVWLLDVEEGRSEASFIEIESRPFTTIDVDELADESYALAIGDASAAGLLDDAVVRMRIRADEAIARNIDVGAIRRALMGAGAHKVYAVQFDVVRENRARVDHVNEDIAPLAAVDAWCEANEIGDEHRAPLALLTNTYLQEVGTA